MIKIEKIELNNFRFFTDDKINNLIYGENRWGSWEFNIKWYNLVKIKGETM